MFFLKKNLGKILEDNFRKSVPDDIFYYRFRDSAGTWGGNESLRFTPSNIADCMLYNYGNLHLVELKNHKGKSIPLSCIVGNKTKEKQIEDLYIANTYAGIYSHLIVFFVDIEKCYDLSIDKLKEFITLGERKSIPISYFQENGIEIETLKLRSNYRFNIEKWLYEKTR